MARLAAFAEAQQLALDDVIAEFRDDLPPEATAVVEKGASGPTIGADPDVIMADLETVGDVSQKEIGTEPHNGTCPYTEQCDKRRRDLPHYRETIPCHWQIWQNVTDCPLYKRYGGAK